MTAVCGYRDPNGTVWIGADTRGINGNWIAPCEMHKIIRAGVWRIGHAGNAPAEDVLDRARETLARCEDAAALSRETRRAFRQAEFADTKPEHQPGPPDYGQELLIAWPNGICTIECDGTVITPVGNFLAIGRGQDVCYGAAAAIEQLKPELTGAAFLNIVLQIAAQRWSSVAEPFDIQKVT
jgi:ATP-dependent protease HslVU (ClpYQ) peptidase subunit